jgi:uncharacterized membrane protein YdbT with pleckstrin-like domain
MTTGDASGSGGGGTGGAISPELVSTMVPRQILQDDEIVLVLTKPSLFFIFYESVFFVAVALMLGVLAVQLPWISSSIYFPPRLVALVTVLACVGRLVWALLVWTSHIYMLTNLRVVTIKGVINVHMFQTQLRRISKTEVYRPLGQRIFATGTIGIATAAAAGQVDSTWVMISRPEETHEQIVAAINKSHPK